MLDAYIIEEIKRREDPQPQELPLPLWPDEDERLPYLPVSTGSSDRGVVIIETGGE